MQHIDTKRGWRCENMEETMNFKTIKKEVERVKSGINGLDNFMEGGFPKGSNIVLSGLPGTGKSLFGMAYIAEGCRNNEKCLYITVEQPPSAIIKQAVQFNWDFPQWQEQGNLKIVHFDFKKPIEKKMLEDILETIENNPYDRIVIDSISAIAHSPLPVSYYDFLKFFEKTSQHGLTTVCITQKDEKELTNKLLDYAGDGLITLDAGAIGKTPNRALQIKKMRYTYVDITPKNFEITKDGKIILL